MIWRRFMRLVRAEPTPKPAAATPQKGLDEDDILPGTDWDDEIRRAVKNAEVVVVFLSRTAISKRGYFARNTELLRDVRILVRRRGQSWH
jgi:hypothetical protein